MPDKTPRATAAQDSPEVRHKIDPTVRLFEIAGYSIDLWCAKCDHAAETTATNLMRRGGGGAFLAIVLKSARCQDCGHRGEPLIRLREQ